MTATEERTELVEVDLSFELPVYIPAVGSDGQLTYKRTDVAPENGLKVKVPAYATESKDALEKFLQQEYEDKCIDMYCPTEANIWLGDKNDKRGGNFKFELTMGQYD
tara:strand:- start:186 stop:506 length:321 start_codon:yes stop_codon:yes gene_type:complete